MKKYTFLVFHQEYNDFLERLRESGVLHVAQKAEGVADNEQLQENILLTEQLRKAIVATRAYLPMNHVLQEADASADVLILMQELQQLEDEKKQLQNAILSTQNEIKRMQVWGDFSQDRLQELEKEGYLLQYFSCSKKQYQEEWETLYHAFPVAETGGVVYFVTINHTNEAFSLPADEIRLNKHNAAQLQADAEALKGLLAAKQAQLEAWALLHLATLEDKLEHTRQALDWTKVNLQTTALVNNKLCLLEGFCPIDKVQELNDWLDEKHIYYTVDDPVEEDHAPVKLRNNWFTRLFEVFTGMYGWPVYGEFDPTPILAPFYLLFFSMCMGDAGYGIILIILGLLLHYKKLHISMFEGLGPIIATLGVGTLVVGFFLGTAFGVDLSSLFPQIDYLFLNGKLMTDGGLHYVTKTAYEAQGLKGGYDIAMVLAILIGVFHICLAMVVKALCYTKRFGLKTQLGTWGWTLLIVGGISAFIICMALSAPMEVTKWVLITIAIVSALGIYVFNTPGRNPLINIGAGLWDTYNMATGILGDTLSYIRLYALGLAGGMLGGAFNNLGLMVMGGSVEGATWQWIPFVLILLVGHVLNLAMSALGAFVHPLRLSFVEYFKNSGYEGKGNLYAPFKK